MNSPSIHHLNPAHHSWMSDHSLTTLVNALNEKGIARIVGGAVRNSLLGAPVDEIDLAVSLDPAAVMECLAEKRIKTVPTGLAYGTVTAVHDRKGYEITTLRQDLSSDGRRPKVAYTDNWEQDAKRRDFTMNALYLDLDGKLYDYVGGLLDCQAGRVRFIGDARERIHEDVLRIFRFFRFSAWYSKVPLNAEGLVACRESADLVSTLSVERCWRELKKTLSAPHLTSVWPHMENGGVLKVHLPEARYGNDLERLEKIERSARINPYPLLRLALLTKANATSARQISLRLKMSRDEAHIFQELSHLVALEPRCSEPSQLNKLYYDHPTLKPEMILLLLAVVFDEGLIEAHLDSTTAWQRPEFPLHGEDLLSLGIAKGPEIGRLLRKIETWWLSEGGTPDRVACLAELRRHL